LLSIVIDTKDASFANLVKSRYGTGDDRWFGHGVKNLPTDHSAAIHRACLSFDFTKLLLWHAQFQYGLVKADTWRGQRELSPTDQVSQLPFPNVR
jgi:hypothetical protein